MSLQVIIFFLLFGGAQGILLCLFFIKNKIFRSAYIFLILYLGVMLLQITLKVMSKTWLMSNWQVLYNFSHFLPLLYGPLIYLFVKFVLRSESFSRKDTKHFIPGIVTLIVFACSFYTILPYPLAFIFYNPYIRLFFLITSISVYHILAYRLWKSHQKNLIQTYNDSAILQMNWLRQLVLVSAAVSTVVALALFLLFIHYPHGHQYRYGFAALSVCIYWISYTALTKPALFTVIKGQTEPKEKTDFTLPVLKVYRPNIKYANSVLSNEDADNIISRLEKLMQEKKLYLKSSLTINDLADILKCSRHHLSQVLNDNLQQSYYDYINGLRIEEAKRLLNDPQYDQLKISSIAYDSGFNSLSSFNEVFKKIAGKTPSEYRKETLKELQEQRV